MRTIGVLGGMGPVATVEFLHRVLTLSQREHGAVQDGEYPPILAYSLSLQGSSEQGVRSPRLLAHELVHGIEALQRGGADFVVIPCNTAHRFVTRLRRAVSIPILSIVDLTVREVAHRDRRRVGVLASESSLAEGLYARPLLSERIVAIDPTGPERGELTRVILNVMGGRRALSDRLAVQRIVERMRRVDGIDGIIVGCTELSLVQPASDYSVPAVDAMDVLAEAAVRTAYGSDAIPGAPGLTSHASAAPILAG